MSVLFLLDIQSKTNIFYIFAHYKGVGFDQNTIVLMEFFLAKLYVRHLLSSTFFSVSSKGYYHLNENITSF